MGITRVKKFSFTMLAAAVAATALMASCGGKASTPPAGNSRGFKTVTLPTAELEDIQRDLENKGTPSGIGIGQSNDLQIARNISTDNARTELAKSIDVHVQRMSEAYAQNVNNQAKKIWEEAVRQITDQHVRGTTVYKTVSTENDEGQYIIYSLVVLNPSIFKKAIEEAMASQEEFELRVKKDDMLAKMDANIAAYENKYKR